MTTPPRPSPRLCIGCSGWSYASWKGRFYPGDLAAGDQLAYYASRFSTVEINNSFYRLPEVTTFRTWRRQVPDTFVFAVKASRYLTHVKRLLAPDEPLARLLTRARGLGHRLGPILYQLPPSLTRDQPRLEGFLQALPEGLQHVIEFRDSSWYVESTFGLLREHGVALCVHDMPGSAIDAPLRGPFVYVRFHGATGRYKGGYSAAALGVWARRLLRSSREGLDVYAYFNNDAGAASTRNAMTLIRHIASLSATSVAGMPPALAERRPLSRESEA